MAPVKHDIIDCSICRKTLTAAYICDIPGPYTGHKLCYSCLEQLRYDDRARRSKEADDKRKSMSKKEIIEQSVKDEKDLYGEYITRISKRRE